MGVQGDSGASSFITEPCVKLQGLRGFPFFYFSLKWEWISWKTLIAIKSLQRETLALLRPK
jgi:hypothetical protein